MEIFKLSDICDIRSGYTKFKITKKSELGNYKILQLRSVDGQGILNINEAIRFHDERIDDTHILKYEEILIRAKGSPSSAGYVNGSIKNTVASSQFFRITVKENRKNIVVPEYLWWFLNQKPSQDYFANHSAGSAQSSINKRTLSNTEIFLPSLNKQKKVVELNQLRIEEKRLMVDLIERKERVFNKMMLDFVNDKELL